MFTHKQVAVYNPFEQKEIEVDEGLVKLLSLCWKHGINTQWSCQEIDIIDKTENYPHLTSGATTICFASPSIAKQFIDVVKTDSIKNMRNWKIAILWNIGLEWTIVSFPPEDISWVEKQIEKAENK